MFIFSLSVQQQGPLNNNPLLKVLNYSAFLLFKTILFFFFGKVLHALSETLAILVKR